MKLFVRGLYACTAVVAGTVFTGCSSPTQGQLFLSSPRPRTSAASPAAPSAAGSQAAPPVNGADVARFHVGDSVTVSFSGTPYNIPDHVESIKEDGNITLPLIDSVHAVGKTAGELQNEIYTNYVPKYYVRLTVTVTSGARMFYVGGEVNSHGTRAQYTDGLTVTKAIQSAGGLTDFANHGKIWIIRASNGQRVRVNYDEALKNPAKDPPVYPDDQINVEKRIF